MRLPGLVCYLCVCVYACTYMCVRQSMRERERVRYEGGSMYACMWIWCIWCMGVGVKADRLRIVIILVPLNHT